MMHRTRNFAVSRRRALLALVVWAVLAVQSGCGQTVALLKVSHVQELRSIQGEFNQAATLENQGRLDQSAGAAITTSAQVTTSYRSVLAGLEELLSKHAEQLKADELLGTTYVLKALTEWRLSEYEAAMATIGQIDGQDLTLQPRDKAIVKSFRGLIMNDQAYNHMQAKSAKYADIKTLLSTAISSFQEGIASLPQNHSMRMYLVIAQLGAVKNWVDLSGEPKRYSSDGAALDPEKETGEICAAFKPVLATFKNEMELAKSRDAESGASLEARWSRTLQVQTMASACP